MINDNLNTGHNFYNSIKTNISMIVEEVITLLIIFIFSDNVICFKYFNCVQYYYIVTIIVI